MPPNIMYRIGQLNAVDRKRRVLLELVRHVEGDRRCWKCRSRNTTMCSLWRSEADWGITTELCLLWWR